MNISTKWYTVWTQIPSYRIKKNIVLKLCSNCNLDWHYNSSNWIAIPKALGIYFKPMQVCFEKLIFTILRIDLSLFLCETICCVFTFLATSFRFFSSYLTWMNLYWWGQMSVDFCRTKKFFCSVAGDETIICLFGLFVVLLRQTFCTLQ